QAVVDMGSNGIRFSISNLQPPTARIMPTLYQHREGISLYDAQYAASGERRPIDEVTILAVLASFRLFQRTCEDFRVPKGNITVLATEATRTALNSEDFRRRIKKAVGWEVTMLPKEEEGRVGAMGIASSLPEVSGLVMDLGGGSTQLSWLIKTADSAEVLMPEQGAVSMPYGAAAVMRRLAEAEKAGKTAALKTELQTAMRNAYETLKVPSQLQNTASQHGGFTLYLSGGGFRGWGYVLMSRHHVKPYPIPVINGFSASRADFLGIDDVKQAAAAALQDEEDEMFRISDRRASQVPAVAFLISAIAEALPLIREVRFCQGGVREGFLFTKLSPEVRSQHPLVVATEPFDTTRSSTDIVDLLRASLPEADGSQDERDEYEQIFNMHTLAAFANLMYYHSSYPKDLQASAAMRSTTSGILAGVHGVLHESRTMLALLLCQRWGGDVPPIDDVFRHNMIQLVASPWPLWWINYLGAVANLIAAAYPAGVTGNNRGRLAVEAAWSPESTALALVVKIKFARDTSSADFSRELKHLEKVGKRRRWV
ncbi:hypothetical protein BAUCODRAFT_54037, partial [Baudoinia panamericana UAMH 10762]